MQVQKVRNSQGQNKGILGGIPHRAELQENPEAKAAKPNCDC